MRNRLRLLVSATRAGLGSLAACLLASCASVSVVDREVEKDPYHRPPPVIYVEKFDVSDAKVEIAKEGEDLQAYKDAVVTSLYESMLERLPEIAPTKPAPGRLPSRGWLIKGQIVWVNHGTKAARIAIGLGLGATKMVTNVQVYNLAHSRTEPMVTFTTTGGSNAEPGFIPSLLIPTPTASGVALSMATMTSVTTMAGSAAGAAAIGVAGNDEDINRTAREIRNYLLKLIYPEPRVPPIEPTGTKPGRASVPRE